jgi:hypothetical protein
VRLALMRYSFSTHGGPVRSSHTAISGQPRRLEGGRPPSTDHFLLQHSIHTAFPFSFACFWRLRSPATVATVQLTWKQHFLMGGRCISLGSRHYSSSEMVSYRFCHSLWECIQCHICGKFGIEGICKYSSAQAGGDARF